MTFSTNFIKKATQKTVSLFNKASTLFGKKKAGQVQGAYRQKTVLRKRILNDDGSITTTTRTETKETTTDQSINYPAPLQITKNPFIGMPKPELEMLQLLREQATSPKVRPSSGKLGEMHEALGSHSVGLGIGTRNTIKFDDELFFPASTDSKGEYLTGNGSVQPESIDSCAAVGDVCAAAPKMETTSFDSDEVCSASIASDQALVGLLFPATPSYHLKSDGSIATESIASTRAVHNFHILTPPQLRCKVFASSPLETAAHVDIFSPTWCEANSWSTNDWAWVEGAQEEVQSKVRAYSLERKDSAKPDLREGFDQAFGWMGGICVS